MVVSLVVSAATRAARGPSRIRLRPAGCGQSPQASFQALTSLITLFPGRVREDRVHGVQDEPAGWAQHPHRVGDLSLEAARLSALQDKAFVPPTSVHAVAQQVARRLQREAILDWIHEVQHVHAGVGQARLRRSTPVMT